MKLLVVEDNPRLSDRIVRKLHGLYNIDIAETGHEAIELAKEIQYGVILLDIGLPDISGIEVCKSLRKMKIDIPILILTGIDDMDTRVLVLECGADDYVTKPFNSDELKARIIALSRRRTRRPPESILEYKDLRMNLGQRTVHRNGQVIALRRKEFDILEYLISNQGRVLTRDMIMNHAWDADKISWNSTIDVHIKHLRDKIDKPFDESIIKTSYGLGYKIDFA